MKFLAGLLALLCCSSALNAQTLAATRTIAAETVITANDILIQDSFTPGSATDPAQIIGMEARVALYPGRPIRLVDVGQPAIIERNSFVVLLFEMNGLKISVEGRALSRAGVGDRVKVMNLASRNIVFGRVDASGAILVRP